MPDAPVPPHKGRCQDRQPQPQPNSNPEPQSNKKPNAHRTDLALDADVVEDKGGQVGKMGLAVQEPAEEAEGVMLRLARRDAAGKEDRVRVVGKERKFLPLQRGLKNV